MAHTQYPGFVNSKETTVTTTCLIGDNHVHVAELGDFPAAPNQATLYADGNDETAETILYTGKSAASGAGTLDTITRGFEGVAKEWPVGTKASRLFTNYDLHALQEDIVLKADIAAPTFTGDAKAVTPAIDDNDTSIATTEFVTKQITQGTQPTLVALADAPSKGGVFNGGFELAPTFVAVQTAINWIDGTAAGSATNDVYGWYGIGLNSFAISFDPIVTHSGKYSLKLSATATNGVVYAYQRSQVDFADLTKHGSRVKPLTKYKITVWIKTNNVAADAIYYRYVQYDAAGILGTYAPSTKISGTTDWQPIITTITTDSDAEYLVIDLWNAVTGNVSDAWFDDITLEEVVENTTFAGNIPTPVRPTTVGVTSTDNIDQSMTTTPDALGRIGSNSGTEYISGQTFTPTKNKITGIYVFKRANISTPTGDILVKIVTTSASLPTTTIIASYQIPKATWDGWTVDAETPMIPLPCLLTAGTEYAVTLTDTVAEGGTKSYEIGLLATGTYAGGTNCYNDGTWHATTSDIYFKLFYAKPTENATIVCNGEKISLSTDEDGLLSGAIIDLDKGKYLYDSGNLGVHATACVFANGVYSATTGGLAGGNPPRVINDWYIQYGLLSGTDATARNVVVKINTILPIKSLKFYTNLRVGTTYITSLIEYSLDGTNWITLQTISNTAADAQVIYETVVPVSGTNIVYWRVSKTANGYMAQISGLRIEADLDTASVPSLILQPLATPVQYSDNITLPSNADRVYLRYAKYANDRGVVIPHLEFCTTATPIKAVPIKVDNAGETNPAIKVIAAESTACTVGTGSDEGGNFILNDGEYIDITTPAAQIKVTYQVGKGTTAFSHLTMNRLYLSSNGVANSAVKDPSHQFNFYLGMQKEGVQKVVEGVQRAVNDIARDVINYVPWQNWTPILTWTGSPTGVTASGRWGQLGKTVSFEILINATDSVGATLTLVSLPTIHANNGMYPPINCYELCGNAYATAVVVAGNLFPNTSTFALVATAGTNGQPVQFRISGSYEAL
jgi:hypothetical protein